MTLEKSGIQKRSKNHTRLVQFYQLTQRSKEYELPTSKKIREALSIINSQTSVYEGSNGLIRLWDRTPVRQQNVFLELWLSRDDMCWREKNGEQSSLGLDDESRLLEKAHAILFDDAYLAFLFNHRAAHAEQIANFLNKFCSDSLGPLKIRPWVSKNTVEKINSTNSINLVKFKIFKQYRAGRAKGLGAVKGLQQVFDQVQYTECEIILRGNNNKEENFTGTVMPMLKKWMKSDSIGQIFGSLMVRGRNTSGNKQEIDFFKDRLLTRIGNFEYEDDGTITDASAFANLQAVYETLKEDLEEAAVFDFEMDQEEESE